MPAMQIQSDTDPTIAGPEGLNAHVRSLVEHTLGGLTG